MMEFGALPNMYFYLTVILFNCIDSCLLFSDALHKICSQNFLANNDLKIDVFFLYFSAYSLYENK